MIGLPSFVRRVAIRERAKRTGRVRNRPAIGGAGGLESLEGRALLATIGSISTVVGTGLAGNTGDGGAATAARVGTPDSVVVDAAGDVYMADPTNFVIRELVYSTGRIITVAGTGISGYGGDGGPATAAKISTPNGLALDSDGNLYFADQSNHVIREVVKGTGAIVTVVGTGKAGYTGDLGPATAATLNTPAAVAFDATGKMYIADYSNNVIRAVDKATGVISTLAGTGTAGYGGDGGPAAKALLASPRALAVDQLGNLYIADFVNQVVRVLNLSSGIIDTYAGTHGHGGYSGDGGSAKNAWLLYPTALATDVKNNLYIADFGNNRVREVDVATGVISTVAGTGIAGFNGDGGPATAAAINYPQGVAVDSLGNLFIGDNANHRVRRVTNSTSTIPTTQPTTTVVSGLQSAGQYGQTLTFTATVSAVNAGGQTPGGMVQFLMDGVNYGQPVALTNTGQASVAMARLNAGTHTISARYTGNSSFGASSASPFQQLMSKAALVVMANAASGRAGDPLPALTASYSGFVNGDTPASLAAAPAVATTATTTSAAGTYPISVSGGASQNYTITTLGSTLTLTPPIKTVIVKGLYTGSKLTGLTITFNGPVLASSVQQLANYIALAPGKDGKYGTKDDVKAALRSAVYSASTNVVTLKLKAAVASTPGLRLQAGNLLNTAGGLVDGAHNGKPGSLLLATFKGKTVSF